MKIYFLTFALIFLTNISHSQSPGNCLHFNGTTNNVTTSLPTVFNNIPSNNITIEAWVYPEGNSFARILFAQLNPSNFVSVSISTGNLIYFYVNNVSGNSTIAGIPANQWTHVACTWVASTQQSQIFFNGVLQSTTPGGTSSTGSDNLMTIGSRTNNAQYFPGRIDELRIWDDIRTPCEIQSAMTTEFTTTQANLVAYYKFNEGVAAGTNTGITSLPEFNNNYNGTLNSFLLNGSTSNWIASGATINSINNTASVVTGTDVQSSCNPLLWIDGNTYTSSNNSATHLIAAGSVNGCDSLVTLDFTLNQATSSVDVQTACGPFQWIDGNTYSSNNNTAVYTYPGASTNGCDSIVTLNLTVNPIYSLVDTVETCNSYTWPATGLIYTNSGNYLAALTSINGCDSTISLNLTIKSVDATVTQTDDITLQSNSSTATYQWLNCNGFTPISGATNQTFIASVNGNYAVEVMDSGCIDTSTCYLISKVGLQESEFGTKLKVFPIPTKGIISIDLGFEYETITSKLFNVKGQLVKTNKFQNTDNFQLEIEGSPGVYFLEISSNNGGITRVEVVKE